MCGPPLPFEEIPMIATCYHHHYEAASIQTEQAEVLGIHNIPWNYLYKYLLIQGFVRLMYIKKYIMYK